MDTFSDESGTFMVPPTAGPSMCCVGTLAASESAVEAMVELHARLVTDWKPASGEIKGRELNERRMSRVLTALSNLDVVPSITCIDMGMESATVLADHKRHQAQRLRDNVAGPEYFQSMRDEIHALAERIERLPDQLYVQSVIQTAAIGRALRTGPLHFAQTDPPTLGAFAWHVDRKDRDIVESERLWRELEKPYLQTMFLQKPALFIKGEHFDYSAMDKFHNPPLAEPPEHLARARAAEMKGPFESSDLRPLVDNLSFEDSRDSPGIQFADVLANAFCRACNRRLGERGWRPLGHLMIRDPQQKDVIQYVTLGPEGRRPVDTRVYGDVVLSIEREARPFLFPPP